MKKLRDGGYSEQKAIAICYESIVAPKKNPVEKEMTRILYERPTFVEWFSEAIYANSAIATPGEIAGFVNEKSNGYEMFPADMKAFRVSRILKTLTKSIRKKLFGVGIRTVTLPSNADLDEYSKTFWRPEVIDIPTLTEALSKERTSTDTSFFLYKEHGHDALRWIAVYSSNFIDRDIPPDIISAASHKRFVDMVDKGIADPPELWLFHLKCYKFGQADWVAYDDAGFAIAGGSIDKNRESEALAVTLSKLPNVAMSHSMPLSTIRRNTKDRRVIDEHNTIEITVLPEDTAASYPLITSFELAKEAEQMAIPKSKKTSLLENWGIPTDVLDDLEGRNAKLKGVADELELESKEKDTDPEEEQEAKKPVPKVTEDKPEDDKDDDEEETGDEAKSLSLDALRKEIAEGIILASTASNEGIAILAKAIEAISSRLDSLEKVADAGEELARKDADETPVASSISELIRKASAASSKETVVRSNSKLAKSAPKETEAENKVITGVGFIDKMLTPLDQVEEE